MTDCSWAALSRELQHSRSPAARVEKRAPTAPRADTNRPEPSRAEPSQSQSRAEPSQIAGGENSRSLTFMTALHSASSGQRRRTAVSAAAVYTAARLAADGATEGVIGGFDLRA